ncbi:Two-component response regulator SSK1p [Malassezia caprae]|uniref:Two-component response regulator SSK1p n=1 Tax=Malassezia caprae TaxID=1381934 RepID=A0AAF0IYB3_9BASI|nr:Two-component response regulator SSK1p [Malassezia caprae]
MAASGPQAYGQITLSLQQCIDLTLQDISSQERPQAYVSISQVALQATMYTSSALQWLNVRQTMGLTGAANAPPQTISTLSAHITELTQLALDAVAAQAGASRVELLLTSPPSVLSATQRAESGHTLRFVGASDDQPWFPSASYPVAVLALLIHIFSCLVHIAGQDSRVLARVSCSEQLNESSVDVFFDATVPSNETTWPAWLGPYADLQSVLDEFGVHLSQSSCGDAELMATEDDLLMAPFRQASNVCCLRISLRRPDAPDLLTSEPHKERDLPCVLPGLSVVHAVAMVPTWRVCVLPKNDALNGQLRRYLSEWGMPVVALDERPDVVVVHNDTDVCFDARERRLPCLFISSRAAVPICSLPAGTSAFPEPVGRPRFLYALMAVTLKGRLPARTDSVALDAPAPPAVPASPDVASTASPQPGPASAAVSPGTTAPSTGADLDTLTRRINTLAMPGGDVASPAGATASPVVEDGDDYFAQAVSRLATQANTAGGRLVRGADGRLAGLYFQPRKTPPTGSPSVGSTESAEPVRAPVPAVPTTVSFGPRRAPRLSRPGAPTSIRLPPARMDIPIRAAPTPYTQLPARHSVRTSAQPQPGVVIGPQATPMLPRRPSDQSPAPLSPRALSRIQKRKLALREEFLPPVKVLIVEDNVINQRILATFLQRKHIAYEIASDGREAVDKWQHGDFHLILMDIQLPVMDGIEATKEIRRLEQALQASRSHAEAVLPVTTARHSVIIVALTASVLITDRVEALAAGCNDFLNKPVSLPWLQRKILEWGSMQYLLHAGLSSWVSEPSLNTFEQQADKQAQHTASSMQLQSPQALDTP